ncbi:hypothetical protein DFH08DRAFT_1045855 [Mycena albidolilacea]|uniref:Alcohol dehydrogenase-like C-terminal domain-containing protein n=1 Tax=Mycena albidolilacea TaxID=1033008 RepID=A0AAD6Z8B1_9AGAR|nr:hypothetical protein DFH08DRAFT_1045855 [Mycena albidolilacea]
MSEADRCYSDFLRALFRVPHGSTRGYQQVNPYLDPSIPYRPTRGPQARTGHPRVPHYPWYLKPVGSTRGIQLKKKAGSSARRCYVCYPGDPRVQTRAWTRYPCGNPGAAARDSTISSGDSAIFAASCRLRGRLFRPRLLTPVGKTEDPSAMSVQALYEPGNPALVLDKNYPIRELQDNEILLKVAAAGEPGLSILPETVNESESIPLLLDGHRSTSVILNSRTESENRVEVRITSVRGPPSAKWRAQAILPDGIKVGGTWLVTKTIPPDAIKLGGDVACDDNGGGKLTVETQEHICRIDVIGRIDGKPICKRAHKPSHAAYRATPARPREEKTSQETKDLQQNGKKKKIKLEETDREVKRRRNGDRDIEQEKKLVKPAKSSKETKEVGVTDGGGEGEPWTIHLRNRTARSSDKLQALALTTKPLIFKTTAQAIRPSHSAKSLSGVNSNTTRLVLGHESSGIPVKLGPKVDSQAVQMGKLYSILSLTSCAHGLNGGPPDGVSPEVAAIASDAGVTAFHAVQKVAQVKPGDKVLIFGIGGLGHLAVQYAKHFGATGAISSFLPDPAARKLALDLGAVEAFDLIELTNKTAAPDFKVDTTIDFVANNQTFNLAMAALRKNDVIFPSRPKCVMIGASSENLVFTTLDIITSGYKFSGAHSEIEVISSQQWISLLKSVGTIRAEIHSEPLENVNKVIDELRAAGITGRKVVIPHTAV